MWCDDYGCMYVYSASYFLIYISVPTFIYYFIYFFYICLVNLMPYNDISFILEALWRRETGAFPVGFPPPQLLSVFNPIIMHNLIYGPRQPYLSTFLSIFFLLFFGFLFFVSWKSFARTARAAVYIYFMYIYIMYVRFCAPSIRRMWNRMAGLSNTWGCMHALHACTYVAGYACMHKDGWMDGWRAVACMANHACMPLDAYFLKRTYVMHSKYARFSYSCTYVRLLHGADMGDIRCRIPCMDTP
jgi:hypothetical protein